MTYGLATHERYVIPWSETLFITSKNIALYRKYIVAPEEYAKQRTERIDYLINDCAYDSNIVNKRVPKTYQSLSGYLIDDLMDRIVFELYSKKDELKQLGLAKYCVQGNFVNGEVQPWEIFVPNRWAE